MGEKEELRIEELSFRILVRDRHFATSSRWTITTPADQTIVTCSVACALDWLVKALLTDIVSGNTVQLTTGEEAA